MNNKSCCVNFVCILSYADLAVSLSNRKYIFLIMLSYFVTYGHVRDCEIGSSTVEESFMDS